MMLEATLQLTRHWRALSHVIEMDLIRSTRASTYKQQKCFRANSTKRGIGLGEPDRIILPPVMLT
jgi:hypothetical protein